jgi:hypothetical protein
VGLLGSGTFSPTIDLGAATVATAGGNGGKVTLLYRNFGGHATGPIHYFFYTGTELAVEGSIDANATDFVVIPAASETDPDNCFSSVFATSGLPGGHYCKVQVQHKPKTSGSVTVGLKVQATLGTNTPQTVAFTGRGTTALNDKLTIAPAFYSFFAAGQTGPVSAGLTFASAAAVAQVPAAFTITNTATATVALTVDMAKAPDVSSGVNFYRVDAPATKTECGTTLDAGVSCFIWVKFLPRTAAVTYTDTFRTSLLTVNGYKAGMIGKVREGTVMSVFEPATGVDFKTVPYQSNSAPMGFTVMSIGDAPTTGNVALDILGGGTTPPANLFTPSGCGSASGALAAFNVESPSTMATCPGQVVFNPGTSAIGKVVGASQTIYLRASFAGTDVAGAADTTMENTNAQELNGSTLQATCINPAALRTVQTGTQPFAVIQPYGTTSTAVKLITITNGTPTSALTVPDFGTTSKVSIAMTEGTVPSTNFILDLDGDGHAESCQKAANQITGDLILNGNQSCVVAVWFAPQAAPASGADFTGVLTASATTGGSTPLTFTGTGRDDLSITAITGVSTAIGATYNFSSVTHATVGSEISFTITNAGLVDSGLLTTGAVGADFVVTSDTCNGQVATAGGSCIVKLKFAPATAGAKTGTLTVSGTPGGTATIALTGTGT